MNQRSSRSHTIFRLTLESRKEGGPTVASVLNLVDLAGSESVKKVRQSFTFSESIGKIDDTCAQCGICQHMETLCKIPWRMRFFIIQKRI
jgi:hypothetical protein